MNNNLIKKLIDTVLVLENDEEVLYYDQFNRSIRYPVGSDF